MNGIRVNNTAASASAIASMGGYGCKKYNVPGGDAEEFKADGIGTFVSVIQAFEDTEILTVKACWGRTDRCRRHYYSCRYVPVCEGRKCNHIKRMLRDLLRDGFIKEAVSMMLSLQNSINSRNGPGGNKNRSVWLRVGVTGVAFQAVNQPCGTQGPLAKSAVAGYIVRETVQIADSGYGVSFRVKACGQKRRLM